MTSKTIHPGQTYTLNQTLSFAGTLTIAGGPPSRYGLMPGGTAIIGSGGVLMNTGLIDVASGVASPRYESIGPAGNLINQGMLGNGGTIVLQGGAGPSFKGQLAGYGATLTSSGTLANAGVIDVMAGGTSGSYSGGSGAELHNTGLLTNTGMISLAGGQPISGDAGNFTANAVLLNAGVVNNDGTISLGGGNGGGYYHSSGAELYDSGDINNSGLILLGGGANNAYGSGIVVDHFMTNAGQITATPGHDNGFISVLGTMLDSGTITLATSPASLESLLVGVQGSSAVLGLSGAAEITAVILNYGTITGSGTIHGTLTNDGSIVATGGILALGATVDNQFGALVGTIAAESGGTLKLNGPVTNGGTIEAMGGSHSGYVVNDATLATSGLLSAAGSAGSYTGSGGTGIGAIANNGVIANTGLIQVAGGGPGGSVYTSGYGGMLENYGTLTNAGTLAVLGGIGGQTAAGYGGGGGVVQSFGSIDNTGVIALMAGNLGSKDARPGIGGYLGVGAGILTNAGTITIGGGVGNAAILAVQSAGTLVMAGGVISGGGYLYINADGGMMTGTGTVSVSHLDNSGTVSVSTFGSLTIDSVINSYLALPVGGSFQIGADATLTLGGSLAATANETVTIGLSGTLVADTATAGIAIVTYAGATLDISNAGSATLNTADTNLIVNLAQSDTLTLSAAAFVTANGGAGNDTIIAHAASQTLIGGTGDTLTGASATGDTFFGTAAALNGDVIGGFAGTDQIDLTDLAPASVVLAYSQGSGEGTLTLTDGSQHTAITLLGSFTQSQFTTGSDSHGGTLVQLAH